jgi:hypothetical protein
MPLFTRHYSSGSVLSSFLSTFKCGATAERRRGTSTFMTSSSLASSAPGVKFVWCVCDVCVCVGGGGGAVEDKNK